MEANFKEIVSKLKEGTEMTVDSAIQWLKEAKIIDGKEVTEEAARNAFHRVAGEKLDFAKFQEGLNALSTQTKQKLEEYQQKLQVAKPQILAMVEAGLDAVNQAIEKAKK